MTPYVTHFHVPLYRTVVDIVFGDNMKVCHSLVHRDLRNVTAEFDCVRALTYPVINGHTAVTFNMRYEPRIQNAIAHEAFHVTMGIMEYVGMKHTRKAEEPFAYLHADILEKLHAAYAKYKKETRKGEPTNV